MLRATPLGHSLSEESAEVQTEVKHETWLNLQRWKVPAGLALPGECVFVTARKPG